MAIHAALAQASSSVAFSGMLCALMAGAKAGEIQVIDLGVAAPAVTSVARAVNDHGLIAGAGSDEPCIFSGAFGWTYTGKDGMRNLTTDSAAGITPMLINHRGDIVAQWRQGAANERAVIYSGKSNYRFLPMPAWGTRSLAVALNNRGDVAGHIFDDSTGANRAVVWRNAEELLFLPDPGDGRYHWNLSMNDDGEVVGTTYGPVSWQAFRWNPGTGLTEFQAEGTVNSNMQALNNKGEAVGTRYLPDGSLRAFVWDKRRGVTDIVSPDGGITHGVAINNKGVVVGDVGSPSNLFIWDRFAGFRKIDGLSSIQQATAINEAGLVIGRYGPAFGTKSRAFFWSQESGMLDMGSLGGAATQVLALNNRGLAVGFSVTSSGECHATAWRFKDEPPAGRH